MYDIIKAHGGVMYEIAKANSKATVAIRKKLKDGNLKKLSFNLK
ncbi:MAG: hypothetical protein ABI261_01870 [Ginsengibacter sp.]